MSITETLKIWMKKNVRVHTHTRTHTLNGQMCVFVCVYIHISKKKKKMGTPWSHSYLQPQLPFSPGFHRENQGSCRSVCEHNSNTSFGHKRGVFAHAQLSQNFWGTMNSPSARIEATYSNSVHCISWEPWFMRKKRQNSHSHSITTSAPI